MSEQTATTARTAAADGYGDGALELASAGDYFALLKPRVMSLVVFTGAVGLVLAPGALHPILAAVAILCIAVGAGAAGAINMWFERDIDALVSAANQLFALSEDASGDQAPPGDDRAPPDPGKDRGHIGHRKRGSA